ncbi:MAG: hypothetical protein COZ06_24945 [Armatimonadetes bacterium CG_4_10_14_3_um_filter_66_18]|nr:MAG: hypothetical protein AUJ96_07110 [Armatimonadetes bacterium CG2_30_66_41]PIU93883.1 MAG: hypothetical protein COS65_10460 [Armatimonadetes bacterium CG06_land_8_20_14_3_00_66_21]PIW21017.1 MAG: hypothetical protein COW34_00515 [Armatimonadetes bacterium CG17_big_fil_post_rev_8_21_14_2_50_66_6]PIX46245.1 MAG: hypothetical protein COZ57_13070 [Armatimonadetes bacterium CG_4_8_14_3_um_filter_66_20]PIY42588.1 MAG: hypothetical protein COZ06_24945 [Armatimonadetes bacterium CG_4_10_14_3_um_f
MGLPALGLLPVLAVLSGANALHAAEPATVSFYECLRCAKAPVVDGKLDDPCWQSLPAMDQFYQYWTPVAKPPPLKTAARLCFDDRGLYMGLTLYEDRLDQIKAKITSRDAPDLWQDDCVEIMLDPTNGGTGYYKFTTNSLATRYDEKTTNMVMDSGWNVEGWQVKTSRGNDAWYIELSLPWSDLDRKPREGDIWSFDLVRYGYCSGAFKGVTWALGGSYANPSRFGHLGFGRFAPWTDAALAHVAKTLAKTKGDRFRMLLPGLVLTHDRGRWQRQGLKEWVQVALKLPDQELQQAGTATAGLSESDVKARLDKSVAELTTKLSELHTQAAAGDLSPGVAALAFDQLATLRRQLADVKWEAKLWALVAEE